jgi:hypothetical protein
MDSGTCASASPKQEFIHIARHIATPTNDRPQHERRLANKRSVELHVVKIIVQVRPLTAVPSVATGAYAGSTVAPMANASSIVTGPIDNEYVRPAIVSLSGALEPTARNRESDQICVVRDSNQDVCVLRMRLVCRQGADQGDLSHTRYDAGLLYKLSDGQKKRLARWCFERKVLPPHTERRIVQGCGSTGARTC